MTRFIYYTLSCYILLLVGCNNWLDVKPTNWVEQEEMFSTENGFKNALTGVYIQMKSPSLYGKNLTMDFTENLAQHWKVNASSIEGYTSMFDYKNASVESLIDGIYTSFYGTMVNINNLLSFVDNGVLSSDIYALVKGEALGLRAFLHFDLLRLYGPIPGQHTNNKILAYAQKVSRDNLPVHTWQEYITFLEKDLNDAEKLLYEVEHKGIKDDFFAYRQNRMNYWAVLALKARFYLWIQNKEKAAEYAAKVISAKKLLIRIM